MTASTNLAAGMTPGAQAPPAQECGTFDLACQAGEQIDGVLEKLTTDVARGAAELVVWATSWWLRTGSVDPRDAAVLAAQGATGYVVSAILVGSVLVQAGRLIVTRKGEPLAMIAAGIGRFALVSALGLTLLHGALVAGDALAVEVLDGAANNFGVFMRDALTADLDNVFVALMLGFLAAVLAILQWLLMALRQAGLLVLAAMLPLAAAGSLTRSTRGWLPRLVGWLIAMVVYKPAAAFIYYIGFSYLSSPSSNQPGGIGTLLTGLMVLGLAVVAMPVLLRFFSWSGAQVSGGGGGGSGFLGAAGAVAMGQSYQQAYAVNRATTMESTGPDSRTTHGAAARSGASATAPASGAAPTSGTTAATQPTSAIGGAAAGGPATSATAAAAQAGAAATRWTGDQMTGGAPPGSAPPGSAPPGPRGAQRGGRS